MGEELKDLEQMERENPNIGGQDDDVIQKDESRLPPDG